jgi:hypothetical protein
LFWQGGDDQQRRMRLPLAVRDITNLGGAIREGIVMSTKLSRASPGELLWIPAKEARQLTWCCILELCLNSEGQYLS